MAFLEGTCCIWVDLILNVCGIKESSLCILTEVNLILSLCVLRESGHFTLIMEQWIVLLNLLSALLPIIFSLCRVSRICKVLKL